MARLRRPPRRPSRRSNYLRAALRPQWARCLAPPTPASATERLLGGKIPTSPRSVIVYKYFVLTIVAYVMQVIYINPVILQYPSSVAYSPEACARPGPVAAPPASPIGRGCAPPRPHRRCCSRASLPTPNHGLVTSTHYLRVGTLHPRPYSPRPVPSSPRGRITD